MNGVWSEGGFVSYKTDSPPGCSEVHPRKTSNGSNARVAIQVDLLR
jgi:hypothetical protein